MKNSNTKIYNSFTDKFNNVYNFNSYIDFASFWFNNSRKSLINIFPNFNELNKCACNSNERKVK